MPRANLWPLRLLPLALLATSAGCQQPTAAPSVRPISMEALHQAGGVPPGWNFTPLTGEVVAGRRAFQELGCYTCHAVHGGQFPAVPDVDKRPGPDLTGMGAHHPAEYFAEAIVNPNAVLVDGPGYVGPDGRSVMPTYPDMTLRQLADLVAYLKSLTSGDAAMHAHHMMPATTTGAPAANASEPAVFLVQVNEVSADQLKAFDDWLGVSGLEDLRTFTGLVSLKTLVNRAAGRRELVTIFGFDDAAALDDFLTQARAADAPSEIRALVATGKGGVYRSSMLFSAPGLSFP